MEMSQLKTGKSVPTPLVTTTMIALHQIIAEDGIAFYELVEFCKDSNHKIRGGADKLKTLALLQSDGSIHSDVREIVLAAIEGEGLDLALVSPYTE